MFINLVKILNSKKLRNKKCFRIFTVPTRAFPSTGSKFLSAARKLHSIKVKHFNYMNAFVFTLNHAVVSQTSILKFI